MNNTVNVLDLDTDAVKYLCNSDRKLSDVINRIGKIEYMTADDPYVFLLEHIIGQMLSNKVADLICGRLYDLCGRISPESIESLTDEELLSVGISRPKIRYIRSLTEVITSKGFNFEELQVLNDEDVIRKLTSLRGIGAWTAKMYLIFFLDRKDVLPYEDGAFLQAYKWLYDTDDISRESIIHRCKNWKPYSSIAARYMYKALDSGLTK